MKPYTCPFDYLHPNGTRYKGTIEADSPEELREHMQNEMEASAGALTPRNFTSPDLRVSLDVKRPVYVPTEKLDEANAKLRAAGLEEVAVADVAAAVAEGGR